MKRKTIFYGVAGEGLGHATRALTLIEKLIHEYEIFVFTYGEAFEFFNKLNHLDINLVYLQNGIQFARKNNKIQVFSTLKNVLVHKFCKNKDFAAISHLVKLLQPNLIITDFEPTVALVARQQKVPLYSVDNQHKFAMFSCKDLPLSLRLFCNVLGFLTEIYIGKVKKCIISTFYYEHGKTIKPNIIKSNVFLRKALTNKIAANKGFVLFYYKLAVGNELLERLINVTKKDIVVYGCPDDKQWKSTNITYKKIDYENFCQDLVNCEAVFCTSGNQLLGEAIFFNKPIFAIPEPNQYEQSVNAYYLEKMNCGMSFEHNNYTEKDVEMFLNEFVVNYKQNKKRTNGVEIASDFIKNYLEEQ